MLVRMKLEGLMKVSFEKVSLLALERLEKSTGSTFSESSMSGTSEALRFVGGEVETAIAGV